uniref:Uncharacterized protein n=1 Tax=candidate division WWE3 bacterium TaxID=2053526 RepID=A0A7C4TQ94_UNCKA
MTAATTKQPTNRWDQFDAIMGRVLGPILRPFVEKVLDRNKPARAADKTVAAPKYLYFFRDGRNLHCIEAQHPINMHTQIGVQIETATWMSGTIAEIKELGKNIFRIAIQKASSPETYTGDLKSFTCKKPTWLKDF